MVIACVDFFNYHMHILVRNGDSGHRVRVIIIVIGVIGDIIRGGDHRLPLLLLLLL